MSHLSKNQESTAPSRLFSLKNGVRMIKACALCFILIITAIYGNQYRTSYTIDADTVGARTVYQHDDPRTTNIVNYLTGRGHLPERERIPLYRQYLEHVLEESNMPIPENLYKMEKTELDQLAIRWYIEKFPNNRQDSETLQALINKLFEIAIKPPLKGFPPDVDNKIWHLLMEVGSPKIRWVQERNEYASQLVAYSAGHKQSFYDPVDNTIYITYKDSVNTLLNEVGHSKQFRDDPVTSFLRLLGSMMAALIGAGFDTEEARELYKQNYRDGETFEGEAHGIIKKRLLRKHDLVTVDEKVPEKS